MSCNVCGGDALNAAKAVSDREDPGVDGTMAYFCFDERYTCCKDAHDPWLPSWIEPNTEGHFVFEPTDPAPKAKLY